MALRRSLSGERSKGSDACAPRALPIESAAGPSRPTNPVCPSQPRARGENGAQRAESSSPDLEGEPLDPGPVPQIAVEPPGPLVEGPDVQLDARDPRRARGREGVPHERRPDPPAPRLRPDRELVHVQH